MIGRPSCYLWLNAAKAQREKARDEAARAVEAYVAGLRAAIAARWDKHSLVVFGHLGDGNLHVIAGVGDATPGSVT